MTENSYTMSDETALGFFDADGGILLNIDKKENHTLSFKVSYYLGQSNSKVDATQKFADKFGSTLTERGRFVNNQSSPIGKKVREFLLNNKPKHPYRLRDYYLSEKIIELLNTKNHHYNKVGKITLIRLISYKSVLNRPSKSNKAPLSAEASQHFREHCLYIKATADEIKQGQQEADVMFEEIEKKLKAYKQVLSTAKFSNDYAMGVHLGDGCFFVGLTWKPPSRGNQRLRCEPEWNISGDDESYCQAFVNTFGGLTVPVDSNGQRKYALRGIQKCSHILALLFHKAQWWPHYKKMQYQRFNKALKLLQAQEHFTEKGMMRLVCLVHGLAEKGASPYSKKELMDWGRQWINNPNRQKRKPKP